MRFTLSNTNLTLELDPEAGGSVSKLQYDGSDILRPAPIRTGPDFDPRDYGAFPMVPFVGRIINGLLHFNDLTIQLPANLPPEPHALHGQGWHTPWHVTARSDVSATLRFEHDADVWPWSYSAEQKFSLLETGLRLDLAVTNLDERPMPAGMGWHPYFPDIKAVLQTPTQSIWSLDPDSGQTHQTLVNADEDLSHEREMLDLRLDTTFSISSPVADLTWPTHKVKLRSDSIFQMVTIYSPSGEDYFCVEPLTHVPNAVNSLLDPQVTGHRILGPGDSLSGTINLLVER